MINWKKLCNDLGTRDANFNFNALWVSIMKGLDDVISQSLCLTWYAFEIIIKLFDRRENLIARPLAAVEGL